MRVGRHWVSAPSLFCICFRVSRVVNRIRIRFGPITDFRGLHGVLGMKYTVPFNGTLRYSHTLIGTYAFKESYHKRRITVNIRYRHTLGTPKKWACIVIMPASDIRYRQICACIVYVYGFFFFGFFFRVFLGFFFGFFLDFFFWGLFFGERDDLRITSPNAYFRCGIPRLGRGASPCFSEKVLCAGKGLKPPF